MNIKIRQPLRDYKESCAIFKSSWLWAAARNLPIPDLVAGCLANVLTLSPGWLWVSKRRRVERHCPPGQSASSSVPKGIGGNGMLDATSLVGGCSARFLSAAASEAHATSAPVLRPGKFVEIEGRILVAVIAPDFPLFGAGVIKRLSE